MGKLSLVEAQALHRSDGRGELRLSSDLHALATPRTPGLLLLILRGCPEQGGSQHPRHRPVGRLAASVLSTSLVSSSRITPMTPEQAPLNIAILQMSKRRLRKAGSLAQVT